MARKVYDRRTLADGALTIPAFLRRLTTPERIALERAGIPDNNATAAEKNAAAEVRAITRWLFADYTVDLDDPVTADGIARLEVLGVLAAGRGGQARAKVKPDEKP